MCPVDEPRAGLATLELGGTSRGTNLIASTLSDSPLGQNRLAVTVKSGVWRFNQSNTFTGGFTLEGGTVFLTGTGGLGQGPVRVRTGATLGGNGVATSASAILQYEGAIISPGDPDENGGIGCLTYDIGAGLSGVRLVIQTTLQTNDSIRVNATLPLPAFLTVEVQAASAADCPESLRIIDATALIGAQDLSAWEIIAPCAYRAVREGSSVLLVKEPAFSADAWQYNMKIRFPGYTGTVLTNFPVLIKLTEGTGNRSTTVSDPNGADLFHRRRRHALAARDRALRSTASLACSQTAAPDAGHRSPRTGATPPLHRSRPPSNRSTCLCALCFTRRELYGGWCFHRHLADLPETTATLRKVPAAQPRL